ncbi:MAG: pirin family protein [Telmatospirillum sp.]|nr:pirin family protein [Telmatospirillum sp.]
MIDVRPFDDLGSADHGWLQARHHFSFGGYYDPRRTGWGDLLVWNDDTIAVNRGFPLHPHADMEIITYVREGAITHRDSLGNKGRTRAGDVQVMSAGTGIRHSEFNLEDEVTRIFQIWIRPDAAGGEPSWGTRPCPRTAGAGGRVTLASGDPGDDALPIRARARVMGGTLAKGRLIGLDVDPARHLYLVPATGSVRVNGVVVGTRDGAAITDVAHLEIEALEEAEIVLVDAR